MEQKNNLDFLKQRLGIFKRRGDGIFFLQRYFHIFDIPLKKKTVFRYINLESVYRYYRHSYLNES